MKKVLKLLFFKPLISLILFLVLVVLSALHLTTSTVSLYVAISGMLISTVFTLFYFVNFKTKNVSFFKFKGLPLDRVSDNFAFVSVIYFLVTFIFAVFFFPATVSQISMQPTLTEGQMVFVVHKSEIKRGDVVVVNVSRKIKTNSSDVLWVKRVIGIPGDEISVDTKGRVYINGIFYEERYITMSSFNKKGLTHTKLNKNEYVLLGDNRGYSYDSRDVGAFIRDDIFGVVTYKVVGFFKLARVS